MDVSVLVDRLTLVVGVWVTTVPVPGPVMPVEIAVSVVEMGGMALVVVLLLVPPKMLEMMLPRSVVEVVGVETGSTVEIVGEAVTPVEAGPETPKSVDRMELITLSRLVRVGMLETGSIVEVGTTMLEIKEERTEVNGKSVTLEGESVETGEAVGETDSVTEVAELAWLTAVEALKSDVGVGSAVDTGRIDKKSELEIGSTPSVVEGVGAVDAPVPVKETPAAEVAVGVEEIPDDTSLTVLVAVGAVDPPVPVKETPESRLVGEDVMASDVDVDDFNIPPGPNVIALPEAEVAEEDTSLLAVLAVGGITTEGTVPVDAIETLVGRIELRGTNPVESTTSVEATDADDR
jgi:hypothetical protein